MQPSQGAWLNRIIDVLHKSSVAPPDCLIEFYAGACDATHIPEI